MKELHCPVATDRVDIFRVARVKLVEPLPGKLVAYLMSTTTVAQMLRQLDLVSREDVVMHKLSQEGCFFVERDGEPLFYVEHKHEPYDFQPANDMQFRVDAAIGA